MQSDSAHAPSTSPASIAVSAPEQQGVSWYSAAATALGGIHGRDRGKDERMVLGPGPANLCRKAWAKVL